MSNKEIFLELIDDNIHRKGIWEFRKWLLEQTDFFEAPASTKYHGAYKGGLVDHSLEVFHQMFQLANLYNMRTDVNSAELESIMITSLFHDVCKHNMYIEATKNVKDSDGKWIAVPTFSFNPEAPKFGAHGAYSVYLITQYMILTREETMAIYHHMGAFDMGKYDNPGQAFEYSKLAWLLHVADEAATYIKGI